MKRRVFLQNGIAGWMGAGPILQTSASRKPPTIALRSGWQTVNIGDIAHTPGVLQVLHDHIPEAKLVFWPVDINPSIESMLLKKFPDLSIVYSRAGNDGLPLDEPARETVEQADVLIHGSGAGIYIHDTLRGWRDRLRKPFGFFGVTVSSIDDNLFDLLNSSRFVFCRESQSVQIVQNAAIANPVVDFAPDGTFAMDLLDETGASAILEQHQLTENRYICVIPRLRYTPYHTFRNTNWSEEKIQHVTTVNDKYKELDHAKLREAVIAWVRATGHQVLVCPEMTYQIDLFDPLVIDPLPDDVKPYVAAQRRFWLPDTASSVYRHARAVVSMECHSPIMALRQGTPAFYIRQPEDTINGRMYYDLGLADWVFEIDRTEGKEIAGRLLSVHRDYTTASRYLAAAMEKADARHRRAARVIRNLLRQG